MGAGHSHGDHDHDHGHRHGQGHFTQAFAVGIAFNLGFVAVEVIFGFKANSMALLSDAGHNFSDVLGLTIAWAGGAPETRGQRSTRQSASPRRRMPSECMRLREVAPSSGFHGLCEHAFFDFAEIVTNHPFRGTAPCPMAVAACTCDPRSEALVGYRSN